MTSRPDDAWPNDAWPDDAWLDLLDLDLDGAAGGELETLERVDGLRARLENVEQPLVHAHLEVLAAVLVLVGRTDDRVAVLLGRQRDRAAHVRLRAEHRLDDLAGRLVDDLVVVRLQPDPNLLLVSHAAPLACQGPAARSDVCGRAATMLSGPPHTAPTARSRTCGSGTS